MSKLMNELKYQLSKIDFTKYSGDEIEESVFVSEINSFARSQAIGFAEWCLNEGWIYSSTAKMWSQFVVIARAISTSDLYSQFLSHQKKQQEGKGE